MPEKTIAKPLSGSEIVQAITTHLRHELCKKAPHFPTRNADDIIERIKFRMGRDCFLVPILAYANYSSKSSLRVQYQFGAKDFFSFQADIAVEFPTTGTAIKSTRIVVQAKEGTEYPNLEMQSVDVEAEDKPRAPNQVRVESHQGVPVMVTRPQGGVEERKITYAPKKKAVVKKPVSA